MEYVKTVKKKIAIFANSIHDRPLNNIFRQYQIGSKQDDTGYGIYDTCRQAGAVIVTAHDHSYARSYLMSNFANFIVDSTSNELQLSGGKSFVAVVGTGGQTPTTADQSLAANKWWYNKKKIPIIGKKELRPFEIGFVFLFKRAKALSQASTPPLRAGALFCNFTNENFADCYYKQVDGVIRDTFTINNSMQKSYGTRIKLQSNTDNAIETKFQSTHCDQTELNFKSDV